MAKTIYLPRNTVFYLRNPLRYRFYRYGCSRDKRLQEVWGKEAQRGIEKK